MEIKLRPKQVAAIKDIQQQKEQIRVLFNELNAREQLIVDLAVDEHDLVGPVKDAKLDPEKLTLSFILPEEVVNEEIAVDIP